MNANEPAYPCGLIPPQGEHVFPLHIGLTKRELLAAMAMHGFLANPAMCDCRSYIWIATSAKEQAAALLAELAKDDCCEWQRDGSEMCTSRCNNRTRYSIAFKFCPFCGKPIKEVK